MIQERAEAPHILRLASNRTLCQHPPRIDSTITYLTPSPQSYYSQVHPSLVLSAARPFFKPEDDLLKHSSTTVRHVDPTRYAAVNSHRRVFSTSTLRSLHSADDPDTRTRPCSVDRPANPLEYPKKIDAFQSIVVEPVHVGINYQTGETASSASIKKDGAYIHKIESPLSVRHEQGRDGDRAQMTGMKEQARESAEEHYLRVMQVEKFGFEREIDNLNRKIASDKVVQEIKSAAKVREEITKTEDYTNSMAKDKFSRDILNAKNRYCLVQATSQLADAKSARPHHNIS